MLTFERCNKPSAYKLAKNVPQVLTSAQNREIETHIAYWEERSKRNDTEGDMAVAEVAIQIVEQFKNESVRELYTGYYATMRRYKLGLLAQSYLCQHLMKDEQTTQFHIYTSDSPYPAIAPEIGLLSDATWEPLDPRVHLDTETADLEIGPMRAPNADETWYRSKNNLYVRRTATAQPSPEYSAMAEQQGLSPDYSQMQTLFPYIATS
ncbi:MAG TPA: hypothetical protein VJR27_03490 [Candidatus Saccharimonadales bacterium]|nr:hypothetical protein [Candidatus Saccharimonadales bacterium]